MTMKKTLIFALALMFMISSSFLVSAVTGSIGNAKMVLYPEVNGWTNTVVEKSIQVNNVNDVPVNITLKLDENASKFIDLVDESFILEAGESRKAQIEIRVRKEGKYEGRVNVFFRPVEGKDAGVVLSSTIVVIAKKESDYEEPEEEEENPQNTTEENEEQINTEKPESTGKSKLLKAWGFSTLILLVILLVLLYIWGKKRNQSKRKRKSK
ncbi:MAG: hypothetical protein ACP5NZ_04290 [Nanobdellota archaeon]